MVVLAEAKKNLRQIKQNNHHGTYLLIREPNQEIAAE
jgi:hypothetical protein